MRKQDQKDSGQGCAACGTGSNYIFCEGCLSWLLEGDTVFVEPEGFSEGD